MITLFTTLFKFVFSIESIENRFTMICAMVLIDILVV